MKQKFLGVSEIQNGFSMVEVLIVLTLIVLVGVSATYYLSGHQKLYKPDDQTLQIADILQEARQISLTQRETLRVEIDLTENQIRLIDENSVTTADDEVTAKERYYNKTGLRISLADSKAKLPGCSTGVAQTPVATACGIRLDGSQDGQGANPGAGASRGYTPRPMADGYQATRINGERFYTGREVWIKIETIGFSPTTNIYETKDITEDILSFGITEHAPIIISSGNTVFSINGYGSSDSRSIVKLQRFIFGGSKVVSSDTNYITSSNWNSTDYN